MPIDMIDAVTKVKLKPSTPKEELKPGFYISIRHYRVLKENKTNNPFMKHLKKQK